MFLELGLLTSARLVHDVRHSEEFALLSALLMAELQPTRPVAIFPQAFAATTFMTMQQPTKHAANL
tara:strand:- start:845 stop:1042 length:198 start_codon:yes stop_codon:yes gene_type:complete